MLMVKKNCYACVVINANYHGTATIWDTEDDAWTDAMERVDAFFEDENEQKHFYFVKEEDGYVIKTKANDSFVRAYKVFETQELEDKEV